MSIRPNTVYMRTWRDRNRKHSREYNRAYYNKTRARRLEVHKESWMRLRLALFTILGGPKCARCGFSDVRALQIDHVNGGGIKQIEKGFHKSNNRFHKYYRDHPKEAQATLQVLCANCNWIKKAERSEVSRAGPKLTSEGKPFNYKNDQSKQYA